MKTENKIIDNYLGILNAKRYGNRVLIFAGLVILAVILFGCGSRKVNRSKTEITETQTSTKSVIDSTKVKTILDSNTKIADFSTTDEITIIPIDNSKPIIFNNQKVFNGVLTIKNKKNNISTNKSIKVSQIKQNSVKTDIKEQKVKKVFVEAKKIDKSASYFWVFGLLLLIPIYFLWRKYKSYLL